MIQKIQFMTSMKFLHVSTLRSHPQGVLKNKAIQAKHTNRGIMPLTREIKVLKLLNTLNLTSIKLKWVLLKLFE
jgi:hypothetical protein